MIGTSDPELCARILDAVGQSSLKVLAPSQAAPATHAWLSPSERTQAAFPVDGAIREGLELSNLQPFEVVYVTDRRQEINPAGVIGVGTILIGDTPEPESV